jgi:CSLREA domain-containing protein
VATGVLVTCGLWLAAVPAQAALTINVDSTADAVDPTPADTTCATAPGPPANGKCTLRAAIQTANQNAGADTINLPSGTYTLAIAGRGEQAAATGDLDLTETVDLVGGGSAATTVDAAGLDRVFDIVAGRVTMSGLTARNGDPNGANGGGIRDDAQLTLDTVTLSGNTTGPTVGVIAGNGGGISVEEAAVASLRNVTIDGNAAASGGGASASDFNASVVVRGGSVISNNNAVVAGGGGDIGNGRFELSDSRVTANHACATPTTTTCVGITAGRAGGLIEEFGIVLVRRSQIDHNTAPLGGGLSEEGGGLVMVEDSTVNDNQSTGSAASNGGGLLEQGAGQVVITNSTFANNHADGDGGGVAADGGNQLSLTNVTISANSAGTALFNTGSGGGVSNTGGDNVSLVNVTLQGNQAAAGGGNLDNCSPASSCLIQLTNTLVTGGSPANCAGVMTSLGHNLDDAASCLFGSGGDLSGVNPALGALASNGGRTQTAALTPGSLAIGAGDNAGCPGSDQRGVPRPQGPICDIGAYESAPPSAVTGTATALGTTTATLGGSGANPDPVAGTVFFQYGTSALYGQTTAAQAIPGVASSTAFAAAVSGLASATLYHFRVGVTTAGGTVFGADQTFTTAANPPALTVLPVLSALRVFPSSFPAAPSGPSATAGRTFGARVSYALNLPATVRFTVQSRLPGRRRGRLCVAPTTGNRSARPCVRTRNVPGSFVRTGRGGANSFRFTGRLAGRRLSPGSYALRAQPSAAGRTGSTRTAGFHIVR